MFELRIKRKFDTPVERLFDAWCKPELIRRWFAPGEMTVPEASADVREGGSYRIVMQDPDDGSQHIVGGEYRTVEANSRLVFTWQWQDSPNITCVALTFRALDEGGSELELLHSEFADQEICDKHESGWGACLANLRSLQQTEKKA